MQALKFLVIGMGVLIFAGLAVIVVTLASRNNDTGDAPPLVAHDIALPAGAELRDATLSEGRLVLRLAMPGGAARVLVYDLDDGRPVGRFDLRPAP
ncbi:MAG: DUF6476 family protein [Alphaproteobacteria bacterium]